MLAIGSMTIPTRTLMGVSSRCGADVDLCRSERAREKLKGNALILTARIIVDDHRERARSYRGSAYKSGVRVALSVFPVKEKPLPGPADRLDLETVLKRLPCRAGP
ncbi:hypothetical protein EMIT0P218_60147 [Pseudomonas sp. IT-P218]